MPSTPPSVSVPLSRFRLPSRYYADSLCPYADHVQDLYNQWCDEMTHLSEADRAKYRVQRLTWASSRGFPHSRSPERALLIGLAYTWMTCFDDYYGLCPAQELDALRRRGIELLQGALPQPTDPPLHHKLAEIGRMGSELMTPAWLDRFAATVDDFVSYLPRENVFRRQRRLPSIAENTEIRGHTIAILMALRFVDVELDLVLPDEVENHPALRRIDILLAQITVWQNDAYTLDKDLRQADAAGENINMVLTLQKELGLSLDDAYRELLRMHDADVVELVQLMENLPDFGLLQQDVETHVLHRAYVVSAIETWYRSDTPRYDDAWVDDYPASLTTP
ncbi:terpene synthase family protein [Streptomyces sp. NPDC055078]